MKHTQGEVQQNGLNGIHQGGTCIALTYGPDPLRKENAQHITAIWNAANGMTTEEAVRYLAHGPSMKVYLEMASKHHDVYIRNEAISRLKKMEGK